MEINRKVLISLFIIGILALGIGWGTHSLFTDTETSSGNTFTAATLDLTVDGPGFSVPITLSNMKPGDESVYYKWILKNVGSIPGKLSVTFNIISDDEGTNTEPELIAENEPYGYQGARATLGHPQRGELSEFLKPGVHPDEINPEALPYLTFIERDDQKGYWIAVVSKEVDTGGSCGWGPSSWNCPSTVISQWAVGPSPAYAGWNFGLYSWNGQTFVYGTLAPGAEIAFFFKVSLAGNLQAWDGCGWHDINDNVIQGDSVTFTMTFTLEQIP
jgi:predicted ribosomally synthesized peptide with SipW-like signal peptide